MVGTDCFLRTFCWQVYIANPNARDRKVSNPIDSKVESPYFTHEELFKNVILLLRWRKLEAGSMKV